MQSSAAVALASIFLHICLLLPTTLASHLPLGDAPAGTRKQRPSSFAVQLPGQSEADAKDIAARYGFRLIGKVCE